MDNANSPRPLRIAAFAQISIATVAIELASLSPGEARANALMVSIAYVTIAGLLASFPRRRTHGQQRPPRWQIACLVCLLISPFVMETMRESVHLEPRPFEVQMLAAFRNLGLALAVLSTHLVCLRMAGVVSLFLMLFAISLADGWQVLVPLAAYAAAGVWWLTLVYWMGLRTASGASTTSHRPPWGVVVTGAALAASVVALAGIGPAKALGQLGEWVNTSGGTGDYDRRSRRGMNDGDETVAGNNPRGAGFAQSETLIESPEPTLYDIISELNGPPRVKPRDTERMIGLGLQRVVELPKPPKDSARPSRSFTTMRESPTRPRDPLTRSARAIYEVSGRTPLHVRVVGYDFFDGIEWHEGRMTSTVPRLENIDGTSWMTVTEPTRTFQVGTADHEIKIARRPDGRARRLVPTPANFSRLRIAKVDQPDFFCWAQDRILRFADRDAPDLISVKTLTPTVDENVLLQVDTLPSLHRPDAPSMNIPPGPGQEKVRELVHRWTDGVMPGWAQVQEVVRRLRTEYVLDPTHRAPPGTVDTVAYFLLESKRGPDYDFAQAAAVCLRHLGRATRLVCGYYGAPDAYDPKTDHTPIADDDLHFWPEVQVNGPTWVIIEPTPGYDVLRPEIPWWERAQTALNRLWEWARSNYLELTGLGVVAIVIALTRRRWIDAIHVIRWRIWPGRSWRDWVIRAERIIERRARWAGASRPHGVTFARWAREVSPELRTMAELGEWATFGPVDSAPLSPGDVWRACRRSVDHCPLRALRPTGGTTA